MFRLLNLNADRGRNQNFGMGVLSYWKLIDESLEEI